MKRFLFQTIVVLFGLAIGGVAGAYLSFRTYDKNHPGVRAFAMTGIFSAVSENQYDKKSGDAKGDLLTLLSIYSSAVSSSMLDQPVKNALRMNRGLTEARLSVIETEAGNVDQAASYLSKAQEDLRAVGWANVSETKILHAVKRQTLPPCGTSAQDVAQKSASASPKPCG